MCTAQNPQASCLGTYSINDELGASQQGRGYRNAERTANPSLGKGKRLFVAMFRSRSRSLGSREGWALPKCEETLPKEDDPCSHIYNYAWCNFCCFAVSLRIRSTQRRQTHHCGKVSSHRMCRLLQVLHPFLDFVWLLRVGPVPWGAIQIKRKCLDTFLAASWLRLSN